MRTLVLAGFGATIRLLAGAPGDLMTALATGLALFPISASMGKTGGKIQKAMTTVILFGLLTFTTAKGGRTSLNLQASFLYDEPVAMTSNVTDPI